MLDTLDHHVLVVGISAEREQWRRTFAAGSSATLTKPFHLEGLLGVVWRNCG